MAAERNSFADRIKQQRPAADPLSAIAPLLRVRQVEVQELCRFASAWSSPHEAQAPGWAQFHVVTKGNCFLEMQNGETLRLQAGSLLLLPHGGAHVVRSARGHRRAEPLRVEYNNAIRIKTNALESSDTELICGRLQFDEAQSGLIVTAMPSAMVLNVSSAQALGHLRSLIQMIDEELRSARAGALAIATDLSSALFVLMLRVHFEQAEASSGLLKLLRSPVCAKAVNAIVSDPAHDWSLDTLAQRAHVSRATLVRAFQKMAGMAPLAFLTEVRLNLARQSLASTTVSLLQVATAVGYASESAFVRAFKRRFGISPGKIRPRVSPG
jgi:AraC family transcriptional activator of mtrCDE